MAILALWFLCCFVISIFFISKPIIPITLAIIIRLSVPTYASTAWVPGLHLAGYLIVIFFVLQAIFYWPRIFRLISSSLIEIILFIAFMSIALLNILSSYSTVLDVVMNIAIVYAPGFLLYLLVKMEVQRTGVRAVKFISFSILLLMVVQAWVSIEQSNTGRRVVYEQYTSDAGWWVSETTGNSVGLVEGHLELTALCSVAIAMTYWIKNIWLQFLTILMIVYMALLATGRASLLVCFATILLILIVSHHNIFKKIIILSLTSVAGILMLFFSEPGQKLLNKVSDDGISTELRVEAYRWVANNLHLFIFSGYPGNRDLRSSGQIGSSLENAYLIISMDYGLIFGIGILLFQIFLAFKNIKNIPGLIMAVAALGMIFANNTNSGFSSNSISGYMIWAVLGLSTVGTLNKNLDGYIKTENKKQVN